MRCEKSIKIFSDLMIMFVISILVFIFLNVLVGALYFVRETEVGVQSGALGYGMDYAKMVYPNLTDEKIQNLLKEQWVLLKSGYSPFTGHMHQAFTGTYVNVAPHLYRISKNQAAWPPPNEKTVIFLFGGSTTFGYGVKDDESIASFIQEQLGEEFAVYNFGVGSFYSTPERIFFEKLLEDGVTPDVAIFIDGFNDLSPNNTPDVLSEESEKLTYLEEMFRTIGPLRHEKIILREISDIFSRLPLTRLIKNLTDQTDPGSQEDSSDESISKALQRYENNKQLIEAIASAFDITPLFVWQPIPFYPPEDQTRISKGYAMMNLVINEKGLADEKQFLDLKDLPQQENVNLYVDAVHYNPIFNQIIAKKIVERIEEL